MVNLPLYLRIVDAKRHDSVSALVALSEFRDRYPQLHIDAFISDSASDNHATYELLHYWNIDAVIALGKSNNGNKKYPDPLAYDNGTPICIAVYKMESWGDSYPKGLKWRYPCVLGKAVRHEAAILVHLPIIEGLFKRNPNGIYVFFVEFLEGRNVGKIL